MILKFVIRNITKRPFLNLIKIAGLSLSFSCTLLIALFLKNELTFDRFNNKSDRIYRFTVANQSVISGKQFARVYDTEYIPGLTEYFPEAENYVRLAPVRGGVIKYNEEYILVNEAFECDSTFFDIFDSVLLVGNPENILDNPGSLVLSRSLAEKIFGNVNPVGEILTLPGGQFYGRDIDFTIKGIMRDFPYNSHFHPDFIAAPVDKTIFKGWAWVYLLLSENASPGKIESGYKEFYSSYLGNPSEEIETEAHLQKISDIHLHSNKLREIEANSNIAVIYTLAAAAFILMLISLANYANLNAGMAVFSDKYIFVSMVSGSSGWNNFKYFFLEGLILVTSSLILTGIITTITGKLIQKHFDLDLFAGNIPLFISMISLFILLGILSGILPLLKRGIITNKTPLDCRNKSNLKRTGLSKSIIVLQYTMSIALIAAVIVIHRQTNFALESSMGFGTDNLICFKDVHSNVQKKFVVFKEELLKFNSVESVSAMFEPPGGEANDMFEFRLEGYTENNTNSADNYVGIFPCDYSFASIFKLSFLSGNNFSNKNEDNEGSGEYIINESAMRRFNHTNPDDIIGKEFGLISNIEGINIPGGKIIGVVKDFHLSGIRKKIEPLVMFKRKELWLINFVISFQQGMQVRALDDIKNVWIRMFPGYPFQYEYVSSIYRSVYKTELLQAKLLSVFTFVSLFICSMGLLGMSLLTTQRRTREIGMRKINGAKTGEIMLMLNWDLIKWTMISFVIAIPLVFFFMNRWLENFAYKTVLSWWIFLLAGLIALTIVLLTVSVQSWKAASLNPVESLRYE